MKRFALLALALALPLAGCAATPDSPGSQPDGATPSDNESGAIDLVGMWRVDAEGAGDETWLRLEADEHAASLWLWMDCGVQMGTWKATDTLFLASSFGSIGCMADARWLEATVSYRASVEGWELLDASGEVTASLRIDGAPEPHPDLLPDYAEPPVITPGARAFFTAASPLPDGLEPASADALEGRWVPNEETPTEPFVEFSRGTWSGSDGCNGNGGLWIADDAGALLATSGPSTLIYCEGAPIPQWLESARTAGFDGETLVLIDAAGAELGRLVRG